jgi:hypothetical protein
LWRAAALNASFCSWRAISVPSFWRRSKAGDSPAADDFAGLRHLRDTLGERFKAGVLLYTGSQTLPFGNRLAAVPVSGLWRV